MLGKNKYKELSKEQILIKILETESLIHSVQDVDVLLEQILTEARSVVNADAGSIYIAEGDRLAIRYAQNDTLQKKLPAGKKLPYIFFDFPISNSTIAGCAANTKKLVNVPDVYNIDPSLPFKFGKSTDEKTGYKTVSNLTIPILSMSGMLLGVLQVLNALDNKGNPEAFSHDDEIYLSHFASNAGIALGHAFLTRAMVMRMIKTAELRDPRETGMHVNRVANYSVEIYDRWAFNNGIPMSEQTKYRDSLKIASMLHDIGKVAISDTILKKPGRLTDEEFSIMKTHTWLGARLFNENDSPLDKLSMEIALRHHENWDGTGYPGHIDIETGNALNPDKKTGNAKGLQGEEIPLAARIVAMADVYDALSSKRSYKDSWTEEKILEEVKKMSGKKFDPQIVEAFFEVLERIQAIKSHFVDE